MPVYERQGGTNWVKIIVIVGIVGLVLVGGCVVIGGIFVTRMAKQMMVSITQTTDASGNAVFDSERFTLAAQPGWLLDSDAGFRALRHTPTGATLGILGSPKGAYTTYTTPAQDPNIELKTITVAGAPVSEMRNAQQGTAQLTLTAPDGSGMTFHLMSGEPFADAEKALIALLNTIQWKPEAAGSR